jgi:xylulokinase
VTLETQEGSAYGAALLALAGEYASVRELCGVAIREVGTVLPDAGNAAVYREGYRVYRGLYPAVRGVR